MRIAVWAEVAGVAGERTHDALFVRSEERRATGSRRALQDSAPTAGVRPGMNRDAAAGHRGHRDKAGEHREFEENAVDGNAHLRSELDGPNFRFTKPRSVISFRLSSASVTSPNGCF